MAGVNRRQFLTAAATVPMVGDIIQPWAAGVVSRDGQDISYDHQREVATGIVSFYGRMDITGKQLSEVRDDEAWRTLINTQCDNLKASLYEYVKKFAARDVENIDQHIVPEHSSLKVKPFERINNTYVKPR